MPAKLIIVGTGRCGTHMLVDMLNDHPDILVFEELMFLFPCITRFGTRRINPKKLLEFALSVSHVNGVSTLAAAIESAQLPREMLEEVITDIEHSKNDLSAYELIDRIGNDLARACGKKYWAEKCPDGGYFIERVHAAWPETKFIHIIRQALPTAISMRKHDGFRVSIATNTDCWTTLSILPKTGIDFMKISERFGDTNLDDYMELWGRRIIAIEQQLSNINTDKTIYRLTYENCIGNPNKSLREIANFLEIRPCRNWLDTASAKVLPPDNSVRMSGKEIHELYDRSPYARDAEMLLEGLSIYWPADATTNWIHGPKEMSQGARRVSAFSPSVRDSAESGGGLEVMREEMASQRVIWAELHALKGAARTLAEAERAAQAVVADLDSARTALSDAERRASDYEQAAQRAMIELDAARGALAEREASLADAQARADDREEAARALASELHDVRRALAEGERRAEDWQRRAESVSEALKSAESAVADRDADLAQRAEEIRERQAALELAECRADDYELVAQRAAMELDAARSALAEREASLAEVQARADDREEAARALASELHDVRRALAEGERRAEASSIKERQILASLRREITDREVAQAEASECGQALAEARQVGKAAMTALAALAPPRIKIAKRSTRWARLLGR